MVGTLPRSGSFFAFFLWLPFSRRSEKRRAPLAVILSRQAKDLFERSEKFFFLLLHPVSPSGEKILHPTRGFRMTERRRAAKRSPPRGLPRGYAAHGALATSYKIRNPNHEKHNQTHPAAPGRGRAGAADHLCPAAVV